MKVSSFLVINVISRQHGRTIYWDITSQNINVSGFLVNIEISRQPFREIYLYISSQNIKVSGFLANKAMQSQGTTEGTFIETYQIKAWTIESIHYKALTCWSVTLEEARDRDDSWDIRGSDLEIRSLGSLLWLRFRVWSLKHLWAARLSISPRSLSK